MSKKHPGFLPISRDEMIEEGIDRFDFILVTGDAYVDHPSFGTAIISRLVESLGYTVGIIAQPNWKTPDDFTRFGAPKYAFLVNSGNVDSMVAHYTVAKNRRNQDAYSPGGQIGKRPDRALIVYCNKIREAYKTVPIVIGGLEASLRRFAHYDYWSNSVRRSILEDTSADLLSFGMGERSMTEIVTRLAQGEPIESLTDIPGTCYITHILPADALICPSFEEVKKDKVAYARATKMQYDEQDPHKGKTVAQGHSKRWLIQNPPAAPLERDELDRVYEYPFTRRYHPSYEKEGGVPAIAEVENSIIQNRGCFGGCSFCAITFHQGRKVTSRSKESILREAERITHSPNFKGYIHDVGGPTANFRFSSCDKKSPCKDRKCLAPEPCKALRVSHEEYADILRAIRKMPGVKKVFVRSGIRYDYLMLDKNDAFFRDLIRYHISGQLKVAPEHCSDRVLKQMGKPPFRYYQAFCDKFKKLNREYGKDQYLVPYLMSSHPGCTLKDAIELALYLKKIHYHPEQVQDFYPTPGTVSTCTFYTGLDPFTMQSVYVPRTPKEKAYQRALLQYHKPQNRAIVREALLKAGRPDLIPVLR